MRRVLDTFWGLYELLRLGVVTRFRLRGRYWRWRHETAFGRGTPGRMSMVRAAIRYGAWAHRMRTGR
jgi:hypothetical protein